MNLAIDRPAGNCRRPTRGFTLIELLAVIAIIATIMLVAVPALKVFHSTAMQTAAREVTNAMLLARQYAITHRTTVRFLIAVDPSGTAISPNNVCRAYTVCEAVKDQDNVFLYWSPLQDWVALPDGIVFVESNAASYDATTAEAAGSLGALTCTISGPDTSGAWGTFNNSAANNLSVTNLTSGGTTPWTAAYVEFKPTGNVSSLLNGTMAGGIRLTQGALLSGSAHQLLISDTNNWVFVEYSQWGGRVRIRYRDSY